MPALIRKTADAIRTGAPAVTVWGSGTPRRELLYSDDLAQACVFLMNLEDERYNTLFTENEAPLINIGTGEDVTIRELAETVAKVLGFKGSLEFDSSKPDGTPRKLMDVARLHALGWHHTTGLEEGIRRTWEQVQDRLSCSLLKPDAPFRHLTQSNIVLASLYSLHLTFSLPSLLSAPKVGLPPSAALP